MPLPIAHGMAGACVVAALYPDFSLRRDWRGLAPGILLGVLPDADYLLTWTGFLGRGWHHTFTHSICFAGWMGLAAAWGLRRGRLRIRDAVMYGLAALTHPMLDFLFTESRGVELLWPLSTDRFRMGVMPPIGYDWRRDSLPHMLSDIATLCAFELFIGGTIFFMILLVREFLATRR